MTAAALTSKPTMVERRYEVDPETGCWLWTGALTTAGYAQLKIDGKVMYAHRVSYQFRKGGIPGHLEPDHLCRRRHCVNPEHLELVTRSENARRGSAAKLSYEKVEEIKAIRGETYREIGARYGVSANTVMRVRKGLAWRPPGS